MIQGIFIRPSASYLNFKLSFIFKFNFIACFGKIKLFISFIWMRKTDLCPESVLPDC